MTPLPLDEIELCTFRTSECALPHDILRLLCTFAWGVAPKRHLFTDLAHVHSYQRSVPPLLLRKFVPRLSQVGVCGRDDQLQYAESLLLNHFCPWQGFQSCVTEAFGPNPYRRGTPYHPSCDVSRRGLWSNCLWFLMDTLRTSSRQFYRRPLQRTLRALFTGGIEEWNAILKAMLPAMDQFEPKHFASKLVHEALWAQQLPLQLLSAAFAEDHLLPDQMQEGEGCLFDRWSVDQRAAHFGFFRKSGR